MLRGMRWLSLLALVTLVLPLSGADETKTSKKAAAKSDKKTDAKSDKKSADEKEEPTYISIGKPIIGEVAGIDNRTIKLVVRSVVRTARGPMPREREVEYEAVETVKVRHEALPPKIDDDGKRVKYTKDELKELKGKGNLWGYTGKFDDVEVGRIIRVFLGKAKGAAKDDPPVITMIHISRPPKEPADGFGGGGGAPASGAARDDDEGFVPVGRPFFAMFVKTENDTMVHLIVKEPRPNNGRMELADKNVSYETAEKLLIRTEVPPLEIDENGKMKKYTKEELTELKGENEKEWGYAGDWENLQPGRIVTVFLGRGKSADKDSPPIITKLWIKKEPGDVRINPAELLFIERKKPSKESKDDDEKTAKDDKKESSKDKKEADKDKKETGKDKTKEKDDGPKPFGKPFLAKVNRVDGGRIALNIPDRVLTGTKLEMREKTVEYNMFDAVRVRMQEPALMFDDKGGVKKYTAEELKELKGTEGLWGYPAEMESLKPGRLVKVFLGKASDDKDAEPVITMILVIKPKGEPN